MNDNDSLFLEAVSKLLETGEKLFFLKQNPEVLDFTLKNNYKILIYSSRIKIEIDLNPDNVKFIASLFNNSIFSDTNTIFCWNIKSLISYIRHFTNVDLNPKGLFFDLKIIENYSGLNKKVPENLMEAKQRYKEVMNGGWKFAYKNVHYDLIFKCIPYLENTPLLDFSSKELKYAFYEIEGQLNGRMQCHNAFSKSYNPHNSSKEVLCNLRPVGWGYIFGVFDYRSMEVNFLAHLSNDKNLKDIIFSRKDFYESVYKVITGDICNSKEKRDFCKSIFLPVMYGLGASGLSKSFKISESESSDILNKIKNNFKESYDWISSYQEMAQQKGMVIDVLGRVRYFDNSYWKARNFVIQGASAIFCLEKLIDLYKISCDEYKLAFSIHDGYGVILNPKSIKDCYLIVKKTLESESKIFDGLKISVQSKFGKQLDSMRVFD